MINGTYGLVYKAINTINSIVINGKYFCTIKNAAEFFNITSAAMSYRMKKQWDGYVCV